MNSLNLLIGTILYEFNAYIIRGFLENENIPCQFKNISFYARATPIADLLKVCLWAKKEDVRHARKLLEVIFDRDRVDVGR
jgi:hypothetical protein